MADLGPQSLKNIAEPVRLPPASGSDGAAFLAASVDDKLANAPRLSIVVLPLENLSGDKDQEYFADAITDDLATDLSHLPDSFVIARNTAFTHKGKPVDVKEIGTELGVRYLLEGLRKAGLPEGRRRRIERPRPSRLVLPRPRPRQTRRFVCALRPCAGATKRLASKLYKARRSSSDIADSAACTPLRRR